MHPYTERRGRIEGNSPFTQTGEALGSNMALSSSQAGPKPGVLSLVQQFPATDWPLLDAITNAPAPANELALGKVLAGYLPVLRHHLMTQFRVSEDQASDWVQSFVLQKVLEQNLIAHADQRRGKFRSFLLQALNNFVIQQLRYARSSLRSATTDPVPLEDVAEFTLGVVQDYEGETFDIAWARTVLARTLEQMKSYCLHSAQAEVWSVFETRLIKPLMDGGKPPAYEQLVAAFGLKSPSQASNLLTTGKRLFGRMIRSVIAEYAGSESDVEREIQDLKAVLYRASSAHPALAERA